MALSPGQTLGDRYRISRPLSSAGSGLVFLAEDSRAQSYCAIKLVPESQLGGPDEAARARRFQEEKNLLPRLNHPGLPRVRDFFRHDGHCCIVTDYIDGPSLEQELHASIKSNGHALGGREVARTALQVLEVLQYLHNLDPAVLHRDVKPANIVRESRSGRIMLVDLGLIRPAPELRPQPVGYTPPEQMQGHAEPRSDLYALGASMNQLLSGQPPVPLGIPPLAASVPRPSPSWPD